MEEAKLAGSLKMSLQVSDKAAANRIASEENAAAKRFTEHPAASEQQTAAVLEQQTAVKTSVGDIKGDSKAAKIAQSEISDVIAKENEIMHTWEQRANVWKVSHPAKGTTATADTHVADQAAGSSEQTTTVLKTPADESRSATSKNTGNADDGSDEVATTKASSGTAVTNSATAVTDSATADTDSATAVADSTQAVIDQTAGGKEQQPASANDATNAAAFQGPVQGMNNLKCSICYCRWSLSQLAH